MNNVVMSTIVSRVDYEYFMKRVIRTKRIKTTSGDEPHNILKIFTGAYVGVVVVESNGKYYIDYRLATIELDTYHSTNAFLKRLEVIELGY